MASKRVLAWHFCNVDMTTARGGEPVVVGETLTVRGNIEPCVRGLHGSVRLIDALRYAPAPMLCRVEIWGGVIHEEDKLVGRNRKVLWAINVENILHEFACDIAEEALKAEESRGRTPDIRSWDAINAKRAWLRGEITLEQLKKRRADADAAYADADAAYADADAAYAAADAAYAAAAYAAYAAAAYAAYAAADAAAADAAADAAYAAYARREWREDANRKLETMVLAAYESQRS